MRFNTDLALTLVAVCASGANDLVWQRHFASAQQAMVRGDTEASVLSYGAVLELAELPPAFAILHAALAVGRYRLRKGHTALAAAALKRAVGSCDLPDRALRASQPPLDLLCSRARAALGSALFRQWDFWGAKEQWRRAHQLLSCSAGAEANVSSISAVGRDAVPRCHTLAQAHDIASWLWHPNAAGGTDRTGAASWHSLLGGITARGLKAGGTHAAARGEWAALCTMIYGTSQPDTTMSVLDSAPPPSEGAGADSGLPTVVSDCGEGGGRHATLRLVQVFLAVHYENLQDVDGTDGSERRASRIASLRMHAAVVAFRSLLRCATAIAIAPALASSHGNGSETGVSVAVNASVLRESALRAAAALAHGDPPRLGMALNNVLDACTPHLAYSAEQVSRARGEALFWLRAMSRVSRLANGTNTSTAVPATPQLIFDDEVAEPFSSVYHVAVPTPVVAVDNGRLHLTTNKAYMQALGHFLRRMAPDLSRAWLSPQGKPSSARTPAIAQPRVLPLRVGFFSSYLRDHSVGRLARGIICNVAQREAPFVKQGQWPTAPPRDHRDIHVVLLLLESSVRPPTGKACHGRGIVNGGGRCRGGVRASCSPSLHCRYPARWDAVTRDLAACADEIILVPDVDALTASRGAQGGPTHDGGRAQSTGGGFGRHRARAAATIGAASLDALIFLDIGIEPLSFLLAFGRLAPVQVAFWGHPSTSGLPDSVDYFVTSEAFEPQGEVELLLRYSEQHVLFSSLGFGFTRPRLPSPAERQRATGSFGGAFARARRNGPVLMLPQTMMKFHPAFDHVLRGVLRALPGAVLVMLEGASSCHFSAATREALLQRLATTSGPETGADNSSATLHIEQLRRRIVFISQLAHRDFLSLLMSVDVMLDTFPFGSGVAALESFACELPVVTLPGAQSVARLASGMYAAMRRAASVVQPSRANSSTPAATAAGIVSVLETCCVASSVDHYVQLVVELGRNASWRLRVKESIAHSSPVLFRSADSAAEWRRFLLQATGSGMSGVI